ncbi:MAG: type II secretion system protein [Chloroflexi bacterium]|nr:type II secretion system protein [Chloroflexota bacterium]
MKHFTLPARGQRGFTLVELVVVIAILGTLAAISVPMVTNYLAQGKQRGYTTDVARIQAAVEAYYTAPDNTRFLGAPQYPIFGADQGSSTPADLRASDDVTGGSPKNPFGGTAGGSATWTDSATGNGIRDAETLRTTTSTDEGWHLVKVTRQAKDYWVDTRNYIIDMTKLTAKGLLDGIPNSASADNAPSGTSPAPTGSYIYYVGSDGKVKTLLSAYPIAGNSGFKDVYP